MTKYRINRDGQSVYRLRSNAHDGLEYRIIANQRRYSEGDVVDTPDGLGVVSEIRTEAFEDTDDEELDASSDSPVYVVALESEDKTVGFYRASDLNASEFPDDLPENPEEDIAEEQNGNAVAANQEGFFEWPQSWVDSEQPARLIALRAWASMGGRHGGGSPGGCTSTMRGKVISPDRWCADFKDRILGWEGWRQGG